MKVKKTQILRLIFPALLLISCQDAEQEEVRELDLELVTEKVELFGEGLVSTHLYERDIAISTDGNELIYTLGDHKQQRRALMQIRKLNGKWGEPEILNISGEYQDIEPFFSEDGNRLFFASNRPIEKGSKRKDYNIWYSDRDGEHWSPPKALNGKINSTGDEFYPSVSSNGNLYFTASRKGGSGSEDIFVSKKIDGEYQEPVALDSSINTEVYEFNSFINPEENLLIFSSFGREDDYGGGDLYYSKKDKDGKWSKAKNMGGNINSAQLDYCPFIDLRRNNLYFTSERIDENSRKMNSIEDIKAFANQTQNGTGNIYKIGIKKLDLN